MRKILLTLPPHDVKMYPPIGLATLASHLMKDNEVKVLDAVVLKLSQQQIIKYAMKYNPDEIWVSVPFTEMAVSARKLLGMLSVVFPDESIVAGGHHVEVCPEEFEGYLGEQVEIDPETMPAWGELGVGNYDMTMYLSTREKALPVQSAFGCPFSCVFCRNSKRREKVRNRSINAVIDEMNWIVRDFGIRGFHFWDETFTLNNNRAAMLAIEIMERVPDVRWSCQTRVGITEPELFRLMARAGCVRVSFGIESGDERVLESINKNIDLADAVKDVRECKKAGMITYAGYMIGHAEDTLISVTKTMVMSRKIGTDYAGFRIAIPYPGSVFREQAEKKGRILTNDWGEYRDDAVVYMPEGLGGCDLKRLKQEAEEYFRAGRVIADHQHLRHTREQ